MHDPDAAAAERGAIIDAARRWWRSTGHTANADAAEMLDVAAYCEATGRGPFVPPSRRC